MRRGYGRRRNTSLSAGYVTGRNVFLFLALIFICSIILTCRRPVYIISWDGKFQSRWDQISNSNLEKIAKHEIGHALGLAHSNDPFDIMHP
ncbi:MAG: matrixin family metalloprotease [archaeon]|nr:matrixin family metalloprotease [archaeon]